MTSPKILLAGGGSGGHISPALAIAEALDERHDGARAHLVCSARPIDAEMIRHAGRTWTPVPAIPPSMRPHKVLPFLTRHWKSRHIVSRLIEQNEIAAVILLGGFVAVPSEAAARQCGIPTLLVNLDRVPGRANRWMRPKVTRAVSGVTTTSPFCETTLGMPIRNASKPPGDRAACKEQLNVDVKKPVLLAVGASQGAGSINTLLPTLAARRPDLIDQWQIIHVTGTRGHEDACRRWQDTNQNPLIFEFQHEMGPLWGAADLVISRAGACSVAEIEFAGCPAIYLPYPHHRDQHQRHNAAPACEAGAAICITDSSHADQTCEDLLSMCEELLARGPALEAMQTAAKMRSGQDAGAHIAAEALKLAL